MGLFGGPKTGGDVLLMMGGILRAGNGVLGGDSRISKAVGDKDDEILTVSISMQ
jgi:hypothetical protein